MGEVNMIGDDAEHEWVGPTWPKAMGVRSETL